MSIIKFLSSLLYTPVAPVVSLDAITEKLSGYQKTLENLGFTAQQADQILYYTPARMLTATRENVTLEVTIDVTGYENVAMIIHTRGFYNTIPVQLRDFEHALAIFGPEQAATPSETKKVA